MEGLDTQFMLIIWGNRERILLRVCIVGVLGANFVETQELKGDDQLGRDSPERLTSPAVRVCISR